MLDLDMRREFNELIKEYGRVILYRRSSKKVTCHCYNDRHRSGKSDCVSCDGSGKMNSFEKAHVIDQASSNRSIDIQETSLGRMELKQRIVWFKYDFIPRAGDVYYQVGWKAGIPVSLYSVYEILSSHEVTGDGGRIEHYEAVIKSRPDLMDNSRETLKRILKREIEVR